MFVNNDVVFAKRHTANYVQFYGKTPDCGFGCLKKLRRREGGIDN